MTAVNPEGFCGAARPLPLPLPDTPPGGALGVGVTLGVVGTAEALLVGGADVDGEGDVGRSVGEADGELVRVGVTDGDGDGDGVRVADGEDDGDGDGDGDGKMCPAHCWAAVPLQVMICTGVPLPVAPPTTSRQSPLLVVIVPFACGVHC